MAKIYAIDLCIEVTRRCNMCCAHCLRGDAQNLDISDDVLREIAKTVQPSTVVFTGGEPSLNIPAIRKYFEYAREYGTTPSSFYVVTNGKANQKELALTLLEFYPEMSDPEMCGLAVSGDDYHDVLPRGAVGFFEGLSFFRPYEHKWYNKDMGGTKWIIKEGRAEENGIGDRPGYEFNHEIDRLITDIDFLDGYVDMELCYVAANGNVVNCCDLSFEHIDEDPVCHISQLQGVVDEFYRSQESVCA